MCSGISISRWPARFGRSRNPAFHEVTWFYPSAQATGNRQLCDVPTTSRTTGSSANWCVPLAYRFSFPAWCQCSSVATRTGVRPPETGTARSGAGTAFCESGPAEIGDGDTLMNVERLIPDEDNLGDVLLTLYAQNRPMGAGNGSWSLCDEERTRERARESAPDTRSLFAV